MDNQKIHQILFVDTKCAELTELVADSSPLGEDEVSGRTLYSLISTGTELAGYQGLWGWTDFPAHPGYSAVFEVEAVGDAVGDIAPGDLAFCMGNHRSRQRVSRNEYLPLPPGLAPAKAPFARIMGVSMTTLTTTNARPPAKVMVMGLGLVGHLAAKIFVRCGYDVIGVDPDEGRRRLASATGIARVEATAPLDDESVVQKVALVLECSGHEQAFLDALNVVRKRGEVVQVATPWRQFTDIPAHKIQHAIFHNYPVVRSGWEWEMPKTPEDFRSGSIWGNLDGALNWLAEGSVDVEGVYAAAAPSDAQQVYQALLSKKEEKLAVLFDLDGNRVGMAPIVFPVLSRRRLSESALSPISMLPRLNLAFRSNSLKSDHAHLWDTE